MSIAAPGILAEIVDLGKAVGLLDSDGNLDPSWFDAPLSRTADVFADDEQRAALLALLDIVLTQDPGARPRPGERWYALLPTGAMGNLFLTIDESVAGRTRVGLAGGLHGPQVATADDVTVDLVVRMPLLDASPTSTTFVVGQSEGPVEIAFGVSLHSADIESLDVTMTLAGSAVTTGVTVVLNEPDGPRTLVLDPAALGSDAIDVVVELLRARLGDAGIPAALARLPELFGLGTSDPLPFDGGAAAVRSWFQRQCIGGAAASLATSLLDVVNDVLGMSGVTGEGTDAAPWQIQRTLMAGLDLALSVSVVESGPAGTRSLRGAVTFTGGVGGAAALDASVTLLDVPLSGASPTQVLPAADVRVRAPAGPDDWLVGTPTSDPRVRSIRAGMRWDGTVLAPLAELLDVSFEGVEHRRIDLLDGASVVQAASAALEAAIAAALGASSGATALLALAGLAQPAGASGYPQVNFGAFAANPLPEIARVHRLVLADPAHPWSGMLAAVGTLIGAPSPASVAGSGTAADPWRVALVTVPPLALEVVAYNASTSADTQLEVGLRLGVDAIPWHAGVVLDALSVTLPHDGSAATIGLLGGVHVVASGSPLVESQIASVAGGTVTVGADAFSLGIDWTAGSPMSGHAEVTNVSVRSSDGTSVVVPTMSYSSLTPSGATASNPLAGFGLTEQQARDVGRLLLARAGSAWGGAIGFAVLGLLGVHKDLVGLSSETPLITDSASVFDHPLTALREYLRGVTTTLGADGTAVFEAWSLWLAGLLAGQLPPTPGARPPADSRATASGNATYDDPWAIPLAGGDVELLGWFEPGGPPPAWANAVADTLGVGGTAFELVDAVRRLSPYDAALANAMTARDVGFTADALERLRSFLTSTDGVVPLASQLPDPATTPGWVLGTELGTAHHLLPTDAAAITQIRDQITAWAPAAVLLVGPPFGSHADWAELLTAAGLAPTAVPNVDFRIPGVEPEGVDVDALTGAGPWYTADLADDGSADPARVVAQISRVVERIGTLHGGGQVALVAHSTAGVPARQYVAAAEAGSVAGLVTLGSPLRGATFEPVADPAVADALRFVVTCLDVAGTSLGDAQTQAAVDHLQTALDGFGAGAPGTPPTAAPYPVGAFVRTTTDLNLNGIPALAIGSRLGGDLVALLGAVLHAVAEALAAAATMPTHLALGWRSSLGLPASAPDAVQADAWLRVDAGRIRLAASGATPEPPRPAHSARVQVRLSRPADWLAGSPTSFTGLGTPMVAARVRWAELGALVGSDGTGGLTISPYATVVDGSVRGVPVTGALGDPDLASGLGAVFQALGATPPAPGGQLAAVLDAMRAVGLVADDPGGGVGLVTDAVAALLVDAEKFLGPRVRAALASPDGLLGLTGPAGGPFTVDVGGNLVVTVSTDPWQVTLSSSEGGVAMGGLVADLTASLALPAFTPSLAVTATFGRVAVTLSQPEGHLRVTAPPWTDGLDLLPVGTGADQRTARDDLLPRLMLSSTMSALLAQAVGPGASVLPIDAVLAGAGAWLSGPGAFGAPDGGQGFDGAKVGALLAALGQAVTGTAGSGLALPGGLTVTATGGDPLVVAVATDPAAPLLGVVGLDLSISIDNQRHASPHGSVSITVPLGGGSGAWSSADVILAASTGGVRLAVAPAGLPTIELLPHFSGFGSLAAAAAALLPALLDSIDSALSPPGTIHQSVRDLAGALDLYDVASGFVGHAEQWAAVARPGWLDSVAGPARAEAVTAALDVLSELTLPGTLSASGSSVRWESGALAVQTGWGTGAPELSVICIDLPVADAHIWLTAGLTGGTGSPTIKVDASVQLEATADVGFNFTPALRVGLDTSGPATALDVRILPLGRDAEGTLAIDLVPAAGVSPSTAALGALVSAWLIPIAGAIGLAVADVQTLLDRPMWTGGPTARDVLRRAGVLADSGLATPFPALPNLPGLVARALSESAALPPVTLVEGLTISVVDDNSRFGVRISGRHDIDAGDLTVTMRFGGDEAWNGGTDSGVTIYLFDLTSTIRFHPGLHVVGVGVGVEGADGQLLVSTDNVVLGAVDGYLSFDLDPAARSPFTFQASGVELEHVGLPLGLLGGVGQGSSNPVATSLLSGGGSGASGGDSQGVNPSVNAAVVYRDGAVTVEFEDTAGPVWLGVHRQFGPIYIDQVGIDVLDGPVVTLLVDGSVHVGPLTVQVDDLELDIPLAKLGQPDQWGLDLKGLAVAFEQDPVSIAGGLVKFPGPPVQYNGMLVVNVGDLGVAAVGSYARPTDAQGGFTSLFVFATLSYPLGGPPWLFITGLGGGVGYNRELVVPNAAADVPGFLLVAAIDDNTLANDPMSALLQIGPNMPPKRGAFWLAAGLRFTTFQVVKTTAVVYVALDSGVEVGVLGVSHMALPDENAAVVSVELALSARFSTEEMLLSVQAQLTDNSWLFTRDCQLTGGFAFFMWFSEAQFVLTLGGYHPSFQRPDNFPVVPRLGFNWRVDDTIVIKGEAYFALTNTCVMVGGRLEAVFDSGAIRAWFTAYADVLVAWDPFRYDVSIGISVGVSATVQICFFGCVRIGIDVSVGASLHLAGPPLHGSVSVDYWVLSFTIPFGETPHDQPYLSWNQFRDKYLVAGDPSGAATSTRVATGLLPPEPPGAAAAAGTSAQPWKVGGEYTFVVDSRLAAERWVDFLSATEHTHPSVGEVDIAPMGATAGDATTVLRLAITTSAGAPVITPADHWSVDPMVGPVPEATWRHFADVPAAARNINAITGIKVAGRAVATGRSQLIAIQKLVDDLPEYAHPLPFTPSLGIDLGLVHRWGVGAAGLVAVTKSSDTATVLTASVALMTGAATDPEERIALGLPASASPNAVSQVRRRRSAPPLVAPLATGMTLETVPSGPAPTFVHPEPAAPLLLAAPRLRAVLRERPQQTPVTTSAPRTSVTTVAAARGAARTTAPTTSGPAAGGAALGLGLHVVGIPERPAPTRSAAGSRTTRNLDFGSAASAAEQRAFTAAADDAVAGGVIVAAGETQVWDLPGEWSGGRVDVTGEPGTAVRVTGWSRAGRVLVDIEAIVIDDVVSVAVPERVRHVSAACLGHVPTPNQANQDAVLTTRLAPAGRIVATGWQSRNTLTQVAPHTALCRGGWLTVSNPTASRRRRANRPTSILRAADVVSRSRVVETSLPIDTGVIGVIVDLTDVAAADGGDLAIAVDGATCSPGVQIAGRRQRMICYDITGRAVGRYHLAVTVGSVRGWSLAGVVGLPGRAAEWSARFSNSIPDDLVPDGPLTDGGACVVRFAAGSEARRTRHA